MQTKKRKHLWDGLTKTQIKNRIFVYSVLSVFYICGILSFITKSIPLGIILVFIPSVALYVLHKIPKYIMRRYCEEAEKEYQLHKNDKNSDRIYLTGEQMYKFIHGEVIDLQDGKTRPFSYKSVMEDKKRREEREETNNG